MLAYTYIEKGKFELAEKPIPTLKNENDAIVRVTLASICTSDLHIKHGSVPRAVPGITVGHEMVGVVEQVGSAVKSVSPGDRVTVNVETFCGTCFFCRNGYVNNCTDPNGGWALGCRIDGGQAPYVRVPYADQGLNKIPDHVSDRQALFVGDVLATGFWAVRISEIGPEDTVLIIGAGPTGICTLLCAMLKHPKRIIICEKDPARLQFVREHYPQVLAAAPEQLPDFVRKNSDHNGADVVLEVAGTEETFRMAWQCARPNGVVTVVALYDRPQMLPLPDMYGKNLTFKTGGVDGCDCEEILQLIAEGKLDTTPLITHTYPLEEIDAAYRLFEEKRDGVIKVAIRCGLSKENAFCAGSQPQNGESDIEKSIRDRLFELQDIKYRDFHGRLMPTVAPETIIGVRTPELRRFAKAFAKTPEAKIFLKNLPHRYYEENNLHGFLIENLKDYGTVIKELEKFLPYVDNWATCDLMRPGVFKKHLPELLEQIRIWICSEHTYTVRFGIEMLMTFYLDEEFQPEYLELVAGVKSEEYYVNMMIAWYFATALAKQYDAAVPYIRERRLEPWTHNKAIQKSVESYRITDEQKAYLRTLKVKLPEREKQERS